MYFSALDFVRLAYTYCFQFDLLTRHGEEQIVCTGVVGILYQIFTPMINQVEDHFSLPFVGIAHRIRFSVLTLRVEHRRSRLLT